MRYEFEMTDGANVDGFIHDKDGKEVLTVPGYIDAAPIKKRAKDKYACMWVFLEDGTCLIGLP